MRFKQHIPNVVFDPRSDVKFEIDFNSKEELLRNEFVEGFSKGFNFHRYSLSSPMEHMSKDAPYTLMQESDEGYKWWVIGFIYDATEEFIESFPIWRTKYRKEHE